MSKCFFPKWKSSLPVIFQVLFQLLVLPIATTSQMMVLVPAERKIDDGFFEKPRCFVEQVKGDQMELPPYLIYSFWYSKCMSSWIKYTYIYSICVNWTNQTIHKWGKKTLSFNHSFILKLPSMRVRESPAPPCFPTRSLNVLLSPLRPPTFKRSRSPVVEPPVKMGSFSQG